MKKSRERAFYMLDRKKRILIAEDGKYWKKKISSLSNKPEYTVEFATSGPECLHKISSFKPDLIILKLMLPEVHGIEILSQVKKNPKYRHIGVIITTSKQMIQDYYAAVEAHVDYFLLKPFSMKKLQLLIYRFFQKTLHVDPFPKKLFSQKEKTYTPPKVKISSYIKFWGTRGSITATGPEYIRFGGNTSCLEVCQGSDLLIIDAGTGIRKLGAKIIRSSIKKIHIFLGHTHWDHIIGFPFFEPLYHSQYEIHIWAPRGFGRSTKDLFTDLLAYEFFPIRLDEVEAKIHFHEIRDRTPVSISPHLKIDFHYTFHPGVTYCFKVYMKNSIFGYATDNEILMGYHGDPNRLSIKNVQLEPHRSLVDFYKDCDVVIHEAQYTSEEYKKKVGWGHSSIPNAAMLFKYAKIPQWIVTHHDPEHDDQFLLKKQMLHRQVMQKFSIQSDVNYAFDGLVLSI